MTRTAARKTLSDAQVTKLANRAALIEHDFRSAFEARDELLDELDQLMREGQHPELGEGYFALKRTTEDPSPFECFLYDVVEARDRLRAAA